MCAGSAGLRVSCEMYDPSRRWMIQLKEKVPDARQPMAVSEHVLEVKLCTVQSVEESSSGMEVEGMLSWESAKAASAWVSLRPEYDSTWSLSNQCCQSLDVPESNRDRNLPRMQPHLPVLPTS